LLLSRLLPLQYLRCVQLVKTVIRVEACLRRPTATLDIAAARYLF